ncbi:MAG: leucyl aminopeptidase family protein [Phycisphaerales bacterium]|nr:leucyl aminopeptidase family protein [Phycisphaerales bacterium]
MPSPGTDFIFQSGGKGAPRGEVLVVPLLVQPQPPMQMVTALDRYCGGAVAELIAVHALHDEVGHVAHATTGAALRRVLLVSLGDVANLSAAEVRRAAASAARWLMAEGIRTASLWVDALSTAGSEPYAGEWAQGMVLAGFRFNLYQESDGKTPDTITLEVRSGEAGHAARVLPEMKAGVTLAQAVNYARRLAHEPANVLNPETLAAEARKLAKHPRIRCTVFHRDQLKRMGMGGLLAVGAGAQPPPCLIQLEYRGAANIRARTVLVGKAITFDTGGYSIKPAQGLEGLKFDKCGGTTVLGILKAAADLGLKCQLVGLIAAAENAISDRAYRPGDILRMMSGKTVEVISTDAEGRLVLADALTYAQEKLRPTVLIDLATLTGGVGIALGKAAAGLMSNDDELAADLGEAGRRTHERLWRLPLWNDYRELIKSSEADIKNSAGKRDAHAIVGGMFLKEFVRPSVPWAHLDIAAVSTEENGRGKVATGFGVRLLIEYLRRRSV